MTDATVAAPRGDYRIIGLISIAHGFSHFYQLVLPVLFPWLRDAFQVSYVELGALMTVMWVVSGLAQTFAGFLVDRFGARTMLFIGMGMYAGAFILVPLVPSFWMLFPIAALAGLGNSVFHPADYAILSARISASRIGRAYSIHTATGSIGWALAPVATIGLASAFSWQIALYTLGGAGLAFLLFMMLQGDALPDEKVSREQEAAAPFDARILASRPVLMCFAYFVLLSMSLVALQGFLVPLLGVLQGVTVEAAAKALTAYLIGAALGTLVGGLMIDRGFRPQRTVMVGLSIAAVFTVAIAELSLGVVALIALLAVNGFTVGITTPSRDMLIRGATPKGASGRVFGFVYSGLDAGGAMAPLMIGWAIDHGHANWAMWAAATALIMGIFTALNLTPRRPAGAPA